MWITEKCCWFQSSNFFYLKLARIFPVKQSADQGKFQEVKNTLSSSVAKNFLCKDNVSYFFLRDQRSSTWKDSALFRSHFLITKTSLQPQGIILSVLEILENSALFIAKKLFFWLAFSQFPCGFSRQFHRILAPHPLNPQSLLRAFLAIYPPWS